MALSRGAGSFQNPRNILQPLFRGPYGRGASPLRLNRGYSLETSERPEAGSTQSHVSLVSGMGSGCHPRLSVLGREESGLLSGREIQSSLQFSHQPRPGERPPPPAPKLHLGFPCARTHSPESSIPRGSEGRWGLCSSAARAANPERTILTTAGAAQDDFSSYQSASCGPDTMLNTPGRRPHSVPTTVPSWEPLLFPLFSQGTEAQRG